MTLWKNNEKFQRDHYHDQDYSSPDFRVYVKRRELMPKRKNETDSGLDLRADLSSYATKQYVLGAGKRTLIPTGVYTAVLPTWEIQVRPRSGLALKHGITIVNSPGTVDADFRGELGVIMLNTSDEDFIIQDLDRIAQIVVVKIDLRSPYIVGSVEELGGTDRGANGYGSSGVN